MNVSFRYFLENDIKIQADHIINSFKDFHPTSNILFPSIKEGNTELVDLAAVLAGTKPACILCLYKRSINTDLIYELLSRAMQSDLIIERDPFKLSIGGYNKHFPSDSYIFLGVGKYNNIKNIGNAYLTLNTTSLNKENLNKIVKAHRIIGINLGYPSKEVEKFVSNLRKELYNNLNESFVLAHVAGPSGSGKTTLADNLKCKYKDIIFKDLDDFDNEAEKKLGFDNIRKKNYTDKMLKKLAETRQILMNNFIKRNKKPIVFVGHHTEGKFVLYIPTENRFLLNVSAKTSAKRAYLRSQKEDLKYRRTLKELPFDEKEAQETIDELISLNYKPVSKEEFEEWLIEKREIFEKYN